MTDSILLFLEAAYTGTSANTKVLVELLVNNGLVVTQNKTGEKQNKPKKQTNIQHTFGLWDIKI